MAQKRSFLVINPNSTESMTAGLKPIVEELGLVDVVALPTPILQTEHVFFTAPSGPPSINNEDDAVRSAAHCLPHLRPLLSEHNGFLVACYSPHPLVPILKSEDAIVQARSPVTGIFEASVAMSLQITRPDEKFGIVTTGKVWEKILSDAVMDFLGIDAQGAGHGNSKRFAGVESTGLNATELHDAPAAEVRRRMMDATKRLVKRGNVGAICLGCAGMAGMGETVRTACKEELGDVRGGRVRIVDGVQAGVAWLEGAVRCNMSVG